MWTKTYYLSNEKLEGYAYIFLRENGVFSAVSDYGNYGYIWSNHGFNDVRQFFVKRHADDYYYFINKLNPKKEYSGEKTYDNIIEWAKNKDIDKGKLKRSLELYDDLYSIHALTLWMDHEAEDFGIYSSLVDEELISYEYSYDVVNFVKKVMPRWRQLLEKELIEEGINV